MDDYNEFEMASRDENDFGSYGRRRSGGGCLPVILVWILIFVVGGVIYSLFQ